MKYIKNILTVTLITIIFSSFAPVNAQGLDYTADINVVSTYVWRGVKQFDGIAMQGSFGASYRAISFGLWYSSVNFGADTPFFETDPFIEISLPTGPLSSALGATLYTYDFSEFNDDADFEYEVYGKVGYSLFELSAFYLPDQGSLDNDVLSSAYWLGLSSSKAINEIDFGLAFETGTYSSRFLMTPQDDAVHLLTVSMSKALMDNLSIGWNYSYGISTELDNTLWMSLGLIY